MNKKSPIGVFDSGYGGLTILSEIRNELPQYDYLYLGDNARAPYGSRSFELIQEFTLEAVQYLFEQGCPLVILACNTASAKALRQIQQKFLPFSTDPSRRVLGVIRPTAEVIGEISKTNEVGILATSGTISSHAYQIEVQKLFPEIKIYEEACPMWVPLVECGEGEKQGADYFIKQDIERLLSHSPNIDTLVLACTHYPILRPKIEQYISKDIQLISQGTLVAKALADYLERHSEMEERLSKGNTCHYLTTESSIKFEEFASVFTKQPVQAEHIKIDNI